MNAVAARARRGERGSVMMLVPAAVLVLLVLGSIAVDSAVVLLAQRDLSNRTAAAANDIAGFAVDEAAFYRGTGDITLDQQRAGAFTDLAFSPDRRPAGVDAWQASAATDGRTVVVTATATVRYIFAPAIPGVARTATVTARSVATARGG
jgi:Flp pilus assembly protein TadG